MKVLVRVLIALSSLAVFPVALFADAFMYYIKAPGVSDSLMAHLSVKQLIEFLANHPSGASELLETFKPIMPYVIIFAILFVLTLLSALAIFIIDVVAYNPKAIHHIAWIGVGCFVAANLVFYALSNVLEGGAIALGAVFGNTLIDTVSGVEYSVFMTAGIRFVSTFLVAISFINMGMYAEAKKKKD